MRAKTVIIKFVFYNKCPRNGSKSRSSGLGSVLVIGARIDAFELDP